jgi:integrase
METIKRKGNTFRYRESYYLGNKKINSPYFTRKSDAKIWKNRVETEKLSKLALGEHYHSTLEINFKEYANKWLHSHVEVNCTKKTFYSYDSILRIHLFPVFGHLNLSQLNEEPAMQLMVSLKKTHKASVIKNIWIVLRSILNKARREKLISFDPLENIKRPKPDLLQDNFWLKPEINQFLRANKTDQLLPFYFVAIHTGLRLAEMCGLKWDRIDFRNNQISVTRTRDKYGLKETTKTKIKRYVPMTEEVHILLTSLRESSNSNPFVFLEANGAEVKYDHIYRRFRKAQEKAGITNQIRFHDLRHSFASNYMMNGGNVFDLQKLLGHTDIKMTMRYAHFTQEHLQGSIRFMNMVQENVTVIPELDLKGSNVDKSLMVVGS